MDSHTITLPEILNSPKKLLPLLLKINDYRYLFAEGGRGGGKSQTIARIILYLCEKNNIRVVCGREIQKSIGESVYTIFVDLIRKHNLYFEIFSTHIVHKQTGATINFRGFRDQGAFNIQGMEGVDILWIDEAQAITKLTLDVLIPTIRKDRAKIYFSMNRHLFDDPVYEFLDGRDDCLHININYNENEFCTEALKKEAEECKAKSESDYNHIWLGQPLERGEDYVFGHDEIYGMANNHYNLRDGYGYRIGGFDIARFGDDKCSCFVIQQMGALHWEEYFVDEWDHRDLNYTTGRILSIFNEQNLDEAIIDEDGLGAGPLDSLQKGRNMETIHGFRNTPIGFSDNKFYCNPRTINTYKLKDMILKGHICVRDTETFKQLLSLMYTYDNYQRKILVPKKKMRDKAKRDNKKWYSPNRADALIMAVSRIGEVKEKQNEMYQPQPQYSKEANLFELGGIR